MPTPLAKKRIDRLAASAREPQIVTDELEILSIAAEDGKLTGTRDEIIDTYVEQARIQGWDASTLEAIRKGVSEMFRN